MGRTNGTRSLKIPQIEMALRAARGNVMLASLALNRTRTSIYQRIQRSEKLQQLQNDLLEEELDLHEGKLRQLGFDKDNVTAVLAFLNAKGRQRGYGRQGLEVSGEIDHKHRHDHFHRRVEELADSEAVEEWRRLISASDQARAVN